MKAALIAAVVTGLFSGSVLAEGGGMGAGKGPGDMGAGKGAGGMGMGMGAGQSKEPIRATQEQRFRNVDGDQNGYITRTEAENHQRLTNNWEKADANSDGKLDASEFSAFEVMEPPGPDR